MPGKARAYVQSAEETARKITGDCPERAAFLMAASRLFKFRDRLMICARRPGAAACASYDLRNDIMRGYIRSGSKGIALLTPGPYGMDVRYVFDVSDTGARRTSRDVMPWKPSVRTMEPVKGMPEEQYYAHPDYQSRISSAEAMLSGPGSKT